MYLINTIIIDKLNYHNRINDQHNLREYYHNKPLYAKSNTVNFVKIYLCCCFDCSNYYTRSKSFMVLFLIKKAIITDKLNYHNLKIDQHNVKDIIIINHFMQNLRLQIFLKSIHFIALIVESVVLDQKFHQMCPPPRLSPDYLQTISKVDS